MNEYDFGRGSESAESGADSWDAVDLSGVSDEGGGGDKEASPETLREIEADWYADEKEGTKAKKEDGEKSDGLFRLKHLDKTLDVGKDELIRLAQKGLDYDRIRGKYSELSAFKTENAKALDSSTVWRERRA